LIETGMSMQSLNKSSVINVIYLFCDKQKFIYKGTFYLTLETAFFIVFLPFLNCFMALQKRWYDCLLTFCSNLLMWSSFDFGLFRNKCNFINQIGRPIRIQQIKIQLFLCRERKFSDCLTHPLLMCMDLKSCAEEHKR